jgi:ATP-binding cassette, subfamily C, bacterial
MLLKASIKAVSLSAFAKYDLTKPPFSRVQWILAVTKRVNTNMRLFFLFSRKYPLQTVFMLLSLLVAGLLEGFGLSMLLPLLSFAIPQQAGELVTQTAIESSKLERLVTNLFSFLNLTPSIENFLMVILITVLLKSAVIILSRRQIGYTVARIATDLRIELLRSMIVAKWEYYLHERIGSHNSAMLIETKQSSEAFKLGVQMVADSIEALVFLAAAFLVSAEASLAAMGCSLAVFFLLRRYFRKVRKTGQRQTNLRRELLASMIDLFQSFKSLKAMAREELADYLLEKTTYSLQKVQQKQVMTQGMLKALQEPLATIFLSVGIYVTLVYWRIPLSNMLIMLFLIGRVIKQVTKIQERYSEIAIQENAYWSLQNTIRNLKEHREVRLGSEIPALKQVITLENVSFSYGESRILKNVHIRFPVGQITAVVGPSGSGKTTILDLVVGLLRPQEGEVCVDGIPLQRFDLKRWRQMIGYVPQETILLHDTIFNNVTLGEKRLKKEDVLTALQAAGALEFVNELPKGIDHIVGERGGKLSGGERQRISIARAIVHRPALIVFDEATSALDSASEEAICETMRRLRESHTIIAISHQTALLKCADQAYVIHGGVAEPIHPTDDNRLISISASGI